MYSETQNKDLKNSALYQSQVGTIEEILNSINIYLLKCSYLLLKPENLTKCLGGMIILLLIIIQIICTIIFYSKSLYRINKYFFNIINNYLNYLLKEPKEILISNNRKILKAKTTAKKLAPPKFSKRKVIKKASNHHNKNGGNGFKERKKAINPNINFYFNYDKNDSNNTKIGRHESNKFNNSNNIMFDQFNKKEETFSRNKVNDNNFMFSSK